MLVKFQVLVFFLLFTPQFLYKILISQLVTQLFRQSVSLVGCTRKFIPPRWYKGGGGVWNPSQEILKCCSILKRFYLLWKAFDLLNKMRYILGVVALLEACDVINNGRHLGRHLGFYQEVEMRLKPREMVIFCALHEK